MNAKPLLPSLVLFALLWQTNTARAQVCTPSSADPELLHYREAAPERETFYADNEGSKPLRIAGALIGDDCQPIQNAVVEIWGATPEGCYSEENGCNDRGDDFFLRGIVRTNELGRFTARTLFPGKHAVDAKLRPAHINLRIKTDKNELITQIYFEGDELIGTDSAASDPSAADRTLTVYEEGSERAVILNLTMSTTAAVTKKLSESVRVYPMAFTDRLTLRGDPLSANASATLMDLQGRTIVKARRITADRELFDRSKLRRLSAGVYYLLIENDTERHVMKLVKQ